MYVLYIYKSLDSKNVTLFFCFKVTMNHPKTTWGTLTNICGLLILSVYLSPKKEKNKKKKEKMPLITN